MKYFNRTAYQIIILITILCANILPVLAEADTRLNAKPMATQPAPESGPRRLPPEFSASELQQTRLILRKRQLITELLDAIRFQNNRVVPRLIRQLGQVAPGSAEFHYFQALQEYRHKEKGHALVLVEKSLNANHRYARAHNLKGLLLVESRHMDAALQSFNKAWQYAPYNPTYAYNIASIHYRLGHMDEAAAMVHVALDAKINLSEAYYLQALIMRKSNKFNKACRSFAKAYEFGQKSDKFFLEYLQTALKANNKEAQLNLLSRVAKMKNSAAYLMSGETHFRFGEYKRAAFFYGMASKDITATSSTRKKYVESLARSGVRAKHIIMRMKIEEKEKTELLIFFTKLKAETEREFEARDQILSPLR